MRPNKNQGANAGLGFKTNCDDDDDGDDDGDENDQRSDRIRIGELMMAWDSKQRQLS